MFVLLIGVQPLISQTTVTIGSGTGTSTYNPLYYLWNYNYSQAIYLASEVNGGGWTGPGRITTIRYMARNSVSTANWRDWRVYIGNTTKTVFTSSSDWVPVASMTEVFNGQIPANVTANQWMEITLDTPFDWDGTSNLVIAVDENTPTWGTSPSWAGFSPGGNRCIYYYSDPNNPDPANPPTGTITSTIAQFQFDIDDIPGPPDPGTGGGVGCVLVCNGNITTELSTGECEKQVNYLVNFAGDCTSSTLVNQTLTLTQNVGAAPINDGLDCGFETSHMRAYSNNNPYVFRINSVEVGSWSGGLQRINVYSYPGTIGGTTLDRSQFVLLGSSANTNIPSQSKGTVTFATPIDVPANTNYIVEQVKLAGQPQYGPASSYSGQTAPCYLYTIDCGVPTVTSYAGLGFGQLHLIQTVNGELVGVPVAGLPEIVQTEGLPSGAFFPVGTTTNCFDLVRGGQVVDQCCFDVTVNPLSNPTRTLACNDHVYISTDENCQVTLNADMFLEGSRYRCWNEYQIIIDGQNMPQGVALNIPLGNHTYEIFDPVTGNRCWGTFTVEDKLPPVLDCNCVDEIVALPVTQFTGALEETDPIISRCGAFFVPQHYDVYEFEVSATGSYTFSASDQFMDTYAYIYQGSFDPLNPCANVIAQNDDTAGGLDPLITTTLTAGTTYYYVYTTYWEIGFIDTYPDPYTITITSTAGNVLALSNASEQPECQFSCYEFDVVSEETAAKLFDPRYKYKLTTPPTATDACGAVNGTFTDEVVNDGMCGPKKLLRHWTFTDAAGWTSTCTQTFTFHPIEIEDLTPPAALVTLSCGEDTSPAAVAAF
ncbi:MAG: hypothetical protein LC127_11830, partial [Chitinophagales bacterium]|nr:hypothetical protein [Chitinophagales bacterium]